MPVASNVSVAIHHFLTGTHYLFQYRVISMLDTESLIDTEMYGSYTPG